MTGVSVEGNETIDDETILNTIAFTSTGWFSKYILREEPFLFNSEILSSDISNVVKLYQREGFLLVKVNAEQITDDENKNIEVVFRIDEGPPVTVSNVNINLNSSFDTGKINTDSLKSLAFNNLTLTAGKRFRDEDIRTDETLITGYYINNGYPHVKINFILNVDTANFLVSVNWFVDPGELSTFGKTSVSGLDYYPENFIRGKLNFTQGEVYNAEKLEETQLRLYELGIFYSVNFNSILNSSPPEVVPVRLKITEAKRFKTTLGVGYGKDEKFRTVVEFTLLGFLKGPGRINFEARKSAIEEFSLRFGYIHPEFLWERTIFRVNTFTSRVNETAYDEDSKGFNIGSLRRFSKLFMASVTYSLENVTLDVNSI
ncbi:MAG: POTRA domain-containing protein, partial [Ignavibacteria bacterium]